MKEETSPDIIWGVDSRWCTGCQRCIRGCPQKAITYNKFTGVVVIDQEICTKCGVCYKFCPIDGALVTSKPAVT
ncbi:MAG: 4Fe-4S binding protein [Dehalococcoidia bacterium]|nr:4Fe-4S binding protein [Dehalococcoidia bacterium]